MSNEKKTEGRIVNSKGLTDTTSHEWLVEVALRGGMSEHRWINAAACEHVGGWIVSFDRHESRSQF